MMMGTVDISRMRRQTAQPSIWGRIKIENHQIGLHFIEFAQALRAVAGQHHVKAMMLQQQAHDIGLQGIVFDDQNGFGHGK